MSSTHINNLKSLFPDLSSDVISAVYHTKSKNFEDTVEALLAFKSTTIDEKEKKRIAKETQSSVISKVMRMPGDSVSKRQAGKYGLAINTVSWEDCARTKGSCWGPCISDMTLNVDDKALPVIRHPNFEDLTWDVPMEKIPLVVGNEVDRGTLYTVTLKEYLEHFKMYLSKPESLKGSTTSFHAPERDSHVIMSAQACMLPVAKSGETKFNVSLYNYQSRRDDPAVLAIVATAQGTSAQIVDGSNGFWGGQKLYFNKNGDKASFIGKRLSDDRKERGVSTAGEMTDSEKQQNMIMIIQVPLKQTRSTHSFPPETPFYAISDQAFALPCAPGAALESCVSYPPASMKKSKCSSRHRAVRREKADVEEAIVSVGESEGKFNECGNLKLERDHRYPVRVTLQYYKSTANGIANDAIFKTIAKQIEESRKFADNVGSLVVGGRTSRPTEHVPEDPVWLHKIPAWWPTFYLTYKSVIPGHVSEMQAKEMLFKTGRVPSSYTMEEAKDRCLRLLGANATAPIVTTTPIWKPV